MKASAIQHGLRAMANPEKILKSSDHEERLFALMLMVQQFKMANSAQASLTMIRYLAHSKHINNRDLVDSSAYNLLGEYLLNRNRAVLKIRAKSALIWGRRIAIVATDQFIRAGKLTIHWRYVNHC